jgi:hypothetical protein
MPAHLFQIFSLRKILGRHFWNAFFVILVELIPKCILHKPHLMLAVMQRIDSQLRRSTRILTQHFGTRSTRKRHYIVGQGT